MIDQQTIFMTDITFNVLSFYTKFKSQSWMMEILDKGCIITLFLNICLSSGVQSAIMSKTLCSESSS